MRCVKKCPEFKNQEKSAAFITGSNTISFVVQEPGAKPKLIYTENPPFILINLAKLPLGVADKERLVVACYREAYSYFVGSDFTVGKKSVFKGSDVYSTAFLMYVGWPMRDVCESMLEKPKVLRNGWIERK